MSGTRAIYLSTGAALAAIAIVSILLYRATERSVVQAYAAQQLAVSHTVAVALESEARALELGLRQFGALPSVQTVDLDYLPLRIKIAFGDASGQIIEQVVRIDADRRLFSWGLSGAVAASGTHATVPDEVWSWFADAANQGTVRVGPVWWDPTAPDSRRVLALPAWRVSASLQLPVPPNTFNGVLAFVVDVEQLVRAYARPAVEPLGGVLVVSVGDGTVVRVAASGTESVQVPASMLQRVPQGDGMDIGTGGDAPVTSWSEVRVADARWLVTIATPYERAASQVRATAAGQLAATALLLVAVPIVAWVVVRRERQAEEERRALQAQLLQAQKMDAIGKLAGGVAHDFNNLLTAILGYTGLILEESRQGTTIHTGASQVRRAAESAAALTQKLLAFSRRQVLQPQRVKLGELLADLKALLNRLLGETVELTFDADADVWPVLADPVQVEQVIINLAVNARDAMPGGGKLSIELRNAPLPEGQHRPDHTVPAGDYVRIVVRDTGLGMDEATRARLFEPFFTTKPKGKGTGLGLSTVYGIVKQSGGYIRIDSEPGRGTSVDLLFPIAPAGAALSPRASAPERHPRGSETILLVEDDAAVRELTQATLERQGYRVLAAGLPEEALTIVRENRDPIDLLLSDVVMPGMHGPELARHVKTIRPRIRLLFMSGYAADVVTSDMLADAALLQKPFASAVLTRAVRLVLDAPGERASA